MADKSSHLYAENSGRSLEPRVGKKWRVIDPESRALLLSFYGRVNKRQAWLWNLNEGETGGLSGYQYPEYLREIRREQLKSNNYGSRVNWSDTEVKRKHAEGVKNRVIPTKTRT